MSDVFKYPKISLSFKGFCKLKFPFSQLTSEQLEKLFKKSSFIDHYFYPRRVPERPELNLKEESELKDMQFKKEDSSDE